MRYFDTMPKMKYLILLLVFPLAGFAQEKNTLIPKITYDILRSSEIEFDNSEEWFQRMTNLNETNDIEVLSMKQFNHKGSTVHSEIIFGTWIQLWQCQHTPMLAPEYFFTPIDNIVLTVGPNNEEINDLKNAVGNGNVTFDEKSNHFLFNASFGSSMTCKYLENYFGAEALLCKKNPMNIPGILDEKSKARDFNFLSTKETSNINGDLYKLYTRMVN